MENSPKRSKAFIITFIIILLLLILGYYLVKNREQLFGTKGSLSTNKIFSPLFGSSKNKEVTIIDNKVVDTGTIDNKNKITGVVETDENGTMTVMGEAMEDLKKGDVLYVFGFNANNNPILAKAIASDRNKSLVFGVAAEDIKKGDIGKVIVSGVLTGVPTNKKEWTLWAIDNALYLSDKIYGGMTKNAPKTPAYTVQVGSVLKVDAINGSIRIGNSADKLSLSLLSSSSSDMRDYWSSVFGDSTFDGIDYNGDGTIDGYDFNGDGIIDIPVYNGEGTPPYNPINIPGYGDTPKYGDDPSITDNNTNTDTNGSQTDTTDPDADTVDKPVGVVNSCLKIEQNPLTFTPEEKARLAILLRKFYLVSSTLKTSDDITTTYNEIEQQSNFITQTKQLTAQCYQQIDGLMGTYGWVRHGNPWYTKTSGGTFPYTSDNTGYSNYSWTSEISMPGTEKVLNIW